MKTTRKGKTRVMEALLGAGVYFEGNYNLNYPSVVNKNENEIHKEDFPVHEDRSVSL
jgi:hypothetical protein